MLKEQAKPIVLTILLLLAIVPATPAADGSTGAHDPAQSHTPHGTADLGSTLPLWAGLPFAGILLTIALMPLINDKFWHHNYGKLSAMWAAVFAIPFLVFHKGIALHEILHIYLTDYFPFIILLWALFTISGGIIVRGSLRGTPLINVSLLVIGTLIASWVGTTGAAMLLIRPLIRANKQRRFKVHIIIFFIFLVANIGGSLTPLGDPPLFLGFIHGVPFFWTLRMIKPMFTIAVMLLAIFYFLDRHYYLKEHEEVRLDNQKPANGKNGNDKIRIQGLHNLLFLGGVLGGVLLSGIWHAGEVSIFGIHVPIQNLTRDGLLIAMGLLSLKFTSTAIRTDNEFSWEPIREVAYLFAGIFMTIIPVLAILKAGENGSMAFIVAFTREPYHFFWVTGLLSSFLDNAPTYLTFFNTALGSLHLTEPQIAEAMRLSAETVSAHFGSAVAERCAEFSRLLLAISTGAVFMGANTYIGNAPNFMVKNIAEESGIEMPSFFGYIVKYSAPILLPLFFIVTLIYFV
ncbi:sodium:proton antiporter [bacterium]|nr:sodium:proton antiporter [candidate division CSSED10-310 bacterium]